MSLTMPESMDECFYFSRRSLDNDGKIVSWVKRTDCPACGKAKLGKPVDKKTGKVKSRSQEYVCPECDHTEPKEEYEPTLTMEIQYTCPYCKKSGEATTKYQRVTFKGVKAYVFACADCGEKIPITKKMAELKKK